ncbi:MAG: CvpA family protein [Ruminococcaceae bacterium]|nr:CvpA family protein [Oscillospiraceae bacterium]
MKAIIDLTLLGILIICAWNGYKKGLIMAVGGIVCIVVSIYGANLLANTFSYDVVPALRPFATGYIESVIGGRDSAVTKRMGWEDYNYSVEDLLAQYPDRVEEYCTECYKELGVDARTAETMAKKAVVQAEESGSTIHAAIGQTLCETASYVGCFLLAFLLIVITLTVLGNLTNLSFKLPRFDLVNDISGAVLGLVTGVLFCLVLVWALKFTGMIIGKDTLNSTVLGRWLMNSRVLLKYLGI